MRILITWILIFPALLAWSQESDVAIVAEIKPTLLVCLNDSSSAMELEQCTNNTLLSSVYKSILYPDSALTRGTEGTVVAQFVVDKNGMIRDSRILRDIGDGCGEAVMLVLRKLETARPFWRPAMNDSLAVNYLFTLPVKFSIPEPPPPPLPYQVYGTDTVYVEYDSMPLLGESIKDLESYLEENLKFPKDYTDSCSVGAMVAQVFIGKNGVLRIAEIFDYAGLGFDFQFELIQVLNASSGKWTPAKYGEKEVNCVFNIRAVFSPKAESCQSVREAYADANEAIRQGEIYYLDGKLEEAHVKWAKAIAAFPNNAEYRLLRGQVLLEEEEFNPLACEDLEVARKNVPLATVFESTFLLMCDKEEAPAEEN